MPHRAERQTHCRLNRSHTSGSSWPGARMLACRRDGTKPMNPVTQPDPDFDRRAPSSLPDLLIRAGLIGALAVLCYRVFSPFLTLTVASIILAITMYPMH